MSRLLIGYGASAVNPYLAMETCEDLVRGGYITGITPRRPSQRHQGARQGRAEDHVEDGHLDDLVVRRRPGVRGGRPGAEFIDEYFTGTDLQARRRRHRRHRGREPAPPRVRVPGGRRRQRTSGLDPGGEYQWRRDGSPHLFNPETVFRLQHSTRNRRYDIFREYTKLVDDQAET